MQSVDRRLPEQFAQVVRRRKRNREPGRGPDVEAVHSPDDEAGEDESGESLRMKDEGGRMKIELPNFSSFTRSVPPSSFKCNQPINSASPMNPRTMIAVNFVLNATPAKTPSSSASRQRPVRLQRQA